MTKEEIIEECNQRLGFETDCEMYSLCQHEKDFYNAIIKALEQQPSEDCVSRQAVKEGMLKYGFHAPDMTVTEFIEDELPPVTPTHGTCKDCKHWDKGEEHCLRLSSDNGWFEDEYYQVYTESDFYCKYFEKRGNENE